MQFRRIASKRMLLDATSVEFSKKKYYWDVTSAEYPRKRYVGCNLRRVSQEEILLVATCAKCFRKKCFDNIDSGVIGLVSDFKMDANSGLEFGILIDLGSDLKFEMIFRLWLFIWAGFLHN
uniref:Uncharacterized protein n=1 Tax=Fagus sylvatica TaxID=28930 RepID=A0A2N9F9W2_FAGSY